MKSSAKKQKAMKITSSFLGSEAENSELLSKKSLLQYSPSVELFINASNESLIAVIRTSDDPKTNPVYKITDFKVIVIIEAFAEATGGISYYYKVPNTLIK